MSGTKLTLNIRDSVIITAKEYAKKQNVSLSKIVEHYLASLAEEKIISVPVSDWAKDLVAVDRPTPDFDHKKEYREYLLDKYSK